MHFEIKMETASEKKSQYEPKSKKVETLTQHTGLLRFWPGMLRRQSR